MKEENGQGLNQNFNVTLLVLYILHYILRLNLGSKMSIRTKESISTHKIDPFGRPTTCQKITNQVDVRCKQLTSTNFVFFLMYLLLEDQTNELISL